MCYKTVLKFRISQKEMFSKWICVGLKKNLDVSASVLISAVIATGEHVNYPKVF